MGKFNVKTFRFPGGLKVGSRKVRDESDVSPIHFSSFDSFNRRVYHLRWKIFIHGYLQIGSTLARNVLLLTILDFMK